MTSSLKRPSLYKPTKGERIPKYTLSLVRSRNKNKAHSFLLDIFRKSGLSKKEIADMLDKKPEQITRWLSGPGNMTFDTLSDLVFATSGNFLFLELKDELSRAKSNHQAAEWVLMVDPEKSSEVKKIAYVPSDRVFKRTVGESSLDHGEQYEFRKDSAEKTRANYSEIQ